MALLRSFKKVTNPTEIAKNRSKKTGGKESETLLAGAMSPGHQACWGAQSKQRKLAWLVTDKAARADSQGNPAITLGPIQIWVLTSEVTTTEVQGLCGTSWGDAYALRFEDEGDRAAAGREQLYSPSHDTPSRPPTGTLLDRTDGATL